MRQSWSLLMLFLMISLGGAPYHLRGQDRSHYVQTTVCRVLSSKAGSRPLNVEIKADIMADHRHSALLIDKQCPGKGIWLDVVPSDADTSVAEFDRVLWSDGSPGYGERRLSAIFFGKLRIGGPLPLNPKHKKISIALMRVENLSDSRHDTP
jgi:hypothetical protein